MDNDPIEELLKAERRDRRITLAMAGLSLLAAAFLSVVPFASGGRIPNLVLGSLVGVVAVALLYQGIGSPLRKPALDALVRRPQEIVWLYFMEGRPDSPAPSRLMVGISDGKTWPALMGRGRERALLAALAQRFPHVTTGYDLDLEERFRRNPASLRRVGR